MIFWLADLTPHTFEMCYKITLIIFLGAMAVLGILSTRKRNKDRDLTDFLERYRENDNTWGHF